jgi:IS4 transposase
VELEEPTRDGETMVVLLSNLPADKADALQIAAIYLGRWKIETAFQTLTTTLRCEVNTLGYPRAALFAFGTALVAYNAIIVVESFIRAEHGKEQAEQLSKYYLGL